MYGLICEELDKRKDAGLGVLPHQALNVLITDDSLLSVDERRFVRTGLSHVDFLVYKKVSKKPLLAVEVDGFSYHKAGTRQAERDCMKNHILELYGLPLVRFSTVGSGEIKTLSDTIDKIFGDENSCENPE